MWSAHCFLRHACSARGGTASLAMVAASTAYYNINNRNFAIQCEHQSNKNDDDDQASRNAHLRKRRATLQKAAILQKSTPPPQRRLTRDELAKLRINEREIMQRWERDEEERWRELPARAWPPYQPDETAMRGIQQIAKSKDCFEDSSSSSVSSRHANGGAKKKSEECQELLFQIATTLVFYNVNPQAGLEQYKELAESFGHVDSMVACGVVLVEGLGIPAPREQEGIEWLQKAARLGSSQACYELGTVYYTGIDGIVAENSEKAVSYFEQAVAKDNHVAAMYMLADCLAEGEGTAKDLARAVPLFYQAAEQGHRYARQRIRELLASKDYQHQHQQQQQQQQQQPP